jgi:hypothetical protein
VGRADILFAGHHHTFRMQDLGGGRTLVACPAMDGGSAWFTNRKGVWSHVGMVSIEIWTEAPYWRAPVLHHHHSLPADWRAARLAVPPVLQLDDPVAGGGAGDQVELIGLGDA